MRLLGSKQILETTSDSNDQFRFENLEPGVYQVELGQPPGLGRPADLTRAWCAMVIVPIDDRTGYERVKGRIPERARGAYKQNDGQAEYKTERLLGTCT